MCRILIHRLCFEYSCPKKRLRSIQVTVSEIWLSITNRNKDLSTANHGLGMDDAAARALPRTFSTI